MPGLDFLPCTEMAVPHIRARFRAALMAPLTCSRQASAPAPAHRARVVHAAAAETRGSEADIISSTHNQYIKHCVKLRTSSSYRRECGRTLLCGLNMIQEQLHHARHTKVCSLRSAPSTVCVPRQPLPARSSLHCLLLVAFMKVQLAPRWPLDVF